MSFLVLAGLSLMSSITGSCIPIGVPGGQGNPVSVTMAIHHSVNFLCFWLNQSSSSYNESMHLSTLSLPEIRPSHLYYWGRQLCLSLTLFYVMLFVFNSVTATTCFSLPSLLSSSPSTSFFHSLLYSVLFV